jgi:hypothetical protein
VHGLWGTITTFNQSRLLLPLFMCHLLQWVETAEYMIQDFELWYSVSVQIFLGISTGHSVFRVTYLTATARAVYQATYRLIHTYHAIPLSCHAKKGLDCVFLIWFTQCGHVWFTHAMPQPCCSESDLSRPQHGCSMGMAWHMWISISCPEMACRWPARVRLLPPTAWSPTKFVIRKHSNPLDCRTSSSHISSYQADLCEGHGTVGEWQGHGMACVN